MSTDKENQPSLPEATDFIRLPMVSKRETTAPTKGEPAKSITLPLNCIGCAMANMSESNGRINARIWHLVNRMKMISWYPGHLIIMIR